MCSEMSRNILILSLVLGITMVLAGGAVVIPTITHNSIDSLQGGQAGQYYHLSESEYNVLAGGLATLAITDGNFIVGDGTNWTSEGGATARNSLGLGADYTVRFAQVQSGETVGYSFKEATDVFIWCSGDDKMNFSTNSIERLEIGNSYASLQVYLSIPDGIVTGPSFTFNDDTDTGIWSSAADTLNISTEASERFEIDANEATFAVPVKTGKIIAPTKGTANISIAPSDANQYIKDISNYVCDGTADDVEINAATSATDGRIFLHAGTFNIAASVTVDDNDLLEGAGEATILSLVNSSDCDVIQNSDQSGGNTNITLKNFRIIGNKANNTSGHGVSLLKVTNFLIENVTAHQSKQAGFFFRNVSNRGRIVNCVATDCGGTGFSTAASEVTNSCNYLQFDNCFSEGHDVGYGYYIVDCNDISLSGCQAKDCADDSIIIGHQSIGPASRIAVTGGLYNASAGASGIHCHYGQYVTITGVEASGNLNWGIAVTQVSDHVSVTNNICCNNITYGGIEVIASTSPDNSPVNVIVGNNICYDNKTYGILVEAISDATLMQNVAINGNICADNGSTGIYINGNGLTSNGGNNFIVNSNIAFSNDSYGIDIHNLIVGAIVSGNLCHENTNFNMRLSSAGTKRIIASNNICEGSTAGGGLHINGSDKLLISDNFFENNYYEGVRFQYDNSDVVVSDNMIFNNEQIGSGTRGGIRLLNTVNNITITGNRCGDNQGSKTQNYGIEAASATCTNVLIANNDVTGNKTGGINPASGCTIINNLGYLTENYDTTYIANGDTTKVVTHGLATTPTIVNIHFLEQGTNDYGRWWVSDANTTSFVLNVSADPGASNLDFGWEAKVR